MLQAYSKNVTVEANSAIPLNNVAIAKGCTATTSGTSSISLNKKGVYQVSVDASAIASAAGIIQFQLSRNGVLLPQAITAETAADATGLHSMSFSTLVQVPQDNCRCSCASSDTVINVVNNGVATTYSQFNVQVTKLC